MSEQSLRTKTTRGSPATNKTRRAILINYFFVCILRLHTRRNGERSRNLLMVLEWLNSELYIDIVIQPIFCGDVGAIFLPMPVRANRGWRSLRVNWWTSVHGKLAAYANWELTDFFIFIFGNASHSNTVWFILLIFGRLIMSWITNTWARWSENYFVFKQFFMMNDGTWTPHKS